MRLRSFFVGAAVMALIGSVYACSSSSGGSTSSDPCSGSSKCSADPAPTADAIKMCQDAQKNPPAMCGTETNALASCFRAKQVCGSDNKTDATATAKACQTETDALTKCLTGGGMDSGSGGGGDAGMGGD